MNLIRATVVSIDSKPELKYGKWFVDCTVTAYGQESKVIAMFTDNSEAERLSAGDEIDI